MLDFQTKDSYVDEIMVVDDNPDNLKLLTNILLREGYQVRVANRGELALLSVAFKKPDLILLDIKMADLDGYEVCRRLKENENSCEIPVIFISALDDIEAKVKGFNLGGIDYISKPFQAEEVVVRVKTHLQLKRAHAILMAEIAERKLVAESLFKEKERFKITLLSVGDGVLSTDHQGKIEIINEVAQVLLGWSQEEARGKYFSEVVHRIDPMTREKCDDVVEQVIHSGTITRVSHHTILIAKDGTERQIADRAAPIKDEHGTVTGVVLVFRDITEERKKQEEMIKCKEEAAFATAENTAKSQFLSNMSHEIRTPMNGFLGMIQIMEMTELTQIQREYIQIVRTSSDALLQIINDILDYTKIEVGQMKLESIVFPLRKVINDVASLFNLSAVGKGLALNVSIASDVPEQFRGDPFRLRQILSNLIGNAVKFTNEGRIDISIKVLEMRSHKDVTLEFVVSDTGVGIADDKRDIIFNSFSQADNSNTRTYSGTGLGLAITKSLVELMNGQIWLESSDENGSCFCCTCILDMIDLNTESTEQLVQKQGGETDHTLKILLAEDDVVNQMIVQDLSAKKGWTMVVTDNGQQALHIYQQQEFDIIMMDCQMPVLDGYHATRAIRQLESIRGTYTPIIAMTTYALTRDREQCFEAGMDDYLMKPIHAKEFYIAVEKWIKNKTKV